MNKDKRMKIFNLPDLGEGLSEAEIHEWYVQAGDRVKTDQPMVAMETAKAIVDVPSPFTGKINKLYGQPGDIINTGSPLVSFETESTGTVVGNLASSDIILTEPAVIPTPLATHLNKVKALPAVRNLAKQLKIDLNLIQGTGKNGVITSEDVVHAANQQNNHSVSFFQEESLRGLRRLMATTMSQSNKEVVTVTIYDDADIYAWQENSDITLRIIRALITACQTEPSLNAWFDGKNLKRQLHDTINLGLAMDTLDGLFVPVIKDIAKFSNQTLRQQIEDYKVQVQNRSIKQENLQEATIVLSNFGMFAGRYASPIVVPPTVAILATGRIRDTVVAYQGQAAVHRIIPLSLTFDHRAITGGEATRFMKALIDDLQLAK